MVVGVALPNVLKGKDSLGYQKTLTAVSISASTYASVYSLDHWYWEADHLILTQFDTTVSVF